MNISGANLLVTGGAGMIGSSTADLPLRKHSPEKVVVLDDLVGRSMSNLAQGKDDPRLTFVCGDICDADTVTRVTRGVDIVIDMGALRITACADDPRRAM